MKIGAESKTKVAVLALLLLVAGLSFARMALVFFKKPAPVAAASDAPAPAARRPAARPKGPAVAVAAPSLDPELRLNLLQSSEGTKYEGTGRNIFRAEAEAPVIPRPVQPAMPVQTGPPPPPPINLRFFGFASKPGETRKVFLAQGEDVFIGGEGDIVDRRYKILRINPNSVEIEDVLNNHRQTIPLTQS